MVNIKWYIIYKHTHEKHSLHTDQHKIIIIQSATVSTDSFASYLGKWLRRDPVPVLFIPGRVFPVEEYFKNDYEEIVRDFKGFNNINKHCYDDEDDDDLYSRQSQFRIGGPLRKGDIDYDLLSKLILMLATENDISRTHPFHRTSTNNTSMDNNINRNLNYQHMFSIATGSILVFMPGVYEINKLCKLLETHSKMTTKQLKIIPLHGNLSAMEQRKVFNSVGNHILKVVISTNVAEASITIPDVSVVVDTCKVKEVAFDVELQATNLITKFASKDSLRQRNGRAGRVSNGRCFRLITINTYNKQPQHSVPEILRVPLESIVLQVKSMLMNIVDTATTNISTTSKSNNNHVIMRSPLYHDIIASMDTMNVLKLCIDIPSHTSIHTAEQLLIQIQALDAVTGRLTSLGQHLSVIPCEPRVGKLLIYGALFGCVFPTSCIAAYMMLRSPFIPLYDANSNQTIASIKVFIIVCFLLHR